MLQLSKNIVRTHTSEYTSFKKDESIFTISNSVQNQFYTLKTSYAVRYVHKYALKDNPSLNSSSKKSQILEYSNFAQCLSSIINDHKKLKQMTTINLPLQSAYDLYFDLQYI